MNDIFRYILMHTGDNVYTNSGLTPIITFQKKILESSGLKQLSVLMVVQMSDSF